MSRVTRISHAFVQEIPRRLEKSTLYVSIEYGTAVHLCCCGCGSEVVTPLTPVDWQIIYDGETISLDPSIGNWSLPCRSHYWIERGRIQWDLAWSDEEIAENRAKTRSLRERFFRSTGRTRRDPERPNSYDDGGISPLGAKPRANRSTRHD